MLKILDIYKSETTPEVNSHGKKVMSCIENNALQTIQLPFANIKKLVVCGATVRVLSEDGSVFIVNSENGDRYTLDTFDGGRKLIVDDISGFFNSVLYLVHDPAYPNFRCVYGGGNDAYGCLGRECIDEKGRDKFTKIFDPMLELNCSSSTVTHIATCYSFSIIVVNYTDIYISGQDWIRAKELTIWKNLQHKCTKKIKMIECGTFQFIIVFEDGSVMYCGDNSGGQMPYGDAGGETLHFVMDDNVNFGKLFGGYDSFVVQDLSVKGNPLQQHKIYGIPCNSTEELLAPFSFYDEVNHSQAKIYFSRQNFAFNFGSSLFYILTNESGNGGVVNVGTDLAMGNEIAEVEASNSHIVFYWKPNSNIFQKKLLNILNNEKITDCTILTTNY